MPQPLPEALDIILSAITDVAGLIRGTASGRQRGHDAPAKVTIRPVDLKGQPHLQLTTHHGTGPTVQNVPSHEAATAVSQLTSQPFGNWHVETTTETLQLRVTKKGDAQLHRQAVSKRAIVNKNHDNVKERLIDPDDPIFTTLGAGADKRRQVDAFLRASRNVLKPLLAGTKPITVVDVGCGNAYLTFAMHRWLTTETTNTVRTIGIEQRPELVAQSADRATEAQLTGIEFVAQDIATATPESLSATTGIDVVIALHACDTATDIALAQAIRWASAVVLAAPCCHRNVQQQLRDSTAMPPPGQAGLISSAILRERFADVMTDAIRADILQQNGYHVDVMEFVDSKHTPRNSLIRANKTAKKTANTQPYRRPDLAETWHVTPALENMLTP